MYVLAGCTPRFDAAVRVNFDGTIDYVTCSDTDEDTRWTAHSSSAEQWTDIAPLADLGPARAGVVVHFARPDSPWETVSVAASTFSPASIDSDAVPLGQWYWNDERDGSRGKGEHCTVFE